MQCFLGKYDKSHSKTALGDVNDFFLYGGREETLLGDGPRLASPWVYWQRGQRR